MEVLFIILHQHLVDNQFLNGIHRVLTKIDKQDKRFQEVFLLSEVTLILFSCYLEWIHGDWLFLGVGDIGAIVMTADSLIGVAGIK